jgi:phosphoribosyl 1,2-cyclic phosphate phosphodiesterase
MSDKFRVTILGCGSSGGVPRVAQGWGRCDPNNPKNRRRRCSILVERMAANGGITRVLIDTSPDLREQLIDAQVPDLDAVVFTHEHADHTHGIDDLRPLVIQHRRRVPVYADAETMHILKSKFGYCFETPPGSEYPPILTAHLIDNKKEFEISGDGGSIAFQPFGLIHGKIEALGFRIENFAYTPDVSAIPEAVTQHLVGLDCWVIDALRETPHPTHFSLSDALHWIGRMTPQRAVLTDLHTDLDYDVLAASLPQNIVPAYDGMVLEWNAAPCKSA